MVAYKQKKNAEPVQKITIVPHTEGSLGYTLLMPEEDKTNLRTKDELMAKITVSMGGRAAEEVVMNTMTNGASGHPGGYQHRPEHGSHVRYERRVRHDGPGLRPEPVSGRRLWPGLRPGRPRLSWIEEVKILLDQCYRDAVALIRENLEDMHKVVAYLLEKETITGGEMVAIIQVRDPALGEEAYASTASRERRPLPGTSSPCPNIHIVSEEIKAPIPLEEPEEPAEATPAEEDSADGGEMRGALCALRRSLPRWEALPTGRIPLTQSPKHNIAPRCGTSGFWRRGGSGGFRDGCQFLARLTERTVADKIRKGAGMKNGISKP